MRIAKDTPYTQCKYINHKLGNNSAKKQRSYEYDMHLIQKKKHTKCDNVMDNQELLTEVREKNKRLAQSKL